MTDSRTSLSAFGSTEEDLDPAPTSVARCARLTEAPDRSDAPEWESSDTEWGLQTRRPASSIQTGAGHVSPQQTRWIVDGEVAEYVEEFSSGEIWGIPDTYGSFDGIAPLVTHVDGCCEAYGYGIDGDALEKALRVLTGGGRYSATDYTVIPCGPYPWILTGPEGSLLCSCMPVDRPDGGQGRRSSEIQAGDTRLDMEEENDQILHGLAHFVRLLEEAKDVDIERAEYHTVRGDVKHSVHSAGDESFSMGAADLATLGTVAKTPSSVEVADRGRIKPPNGDHTVAINWDGPEHEVGDVVDERIVAGYEFAWEDPADSLERIATVRTYWLSEGYSSFRLNYWSARLVTVLP
ncbi:hypothetical protein [Halorientalis pallida]|uniref:Uncharacterized protein n=1 Tax=Halorientalis pallida TaxID=2479928 RepID=A0A498KSV8_9EURY|nr:hypothetical protein [Halorientalis pallida]RXK47726.1 hypothetical protein EAF64_13805 [Halorientalis pallida]